MKQWITVVVMVKLKRDGFIWKLVFFIGNDGIECFIVIKQNQK